MGAAVQHQEREPSVQMARQVAPEHQTAATVERGVCAAPITGQANRDHNSQVEENVKDLVHEDKLVVRYSVDVVNQDGPHAIDIFGDGSCSYQYINVGFSCAYATYKYCNGELQQNGNLGGPPVASSFDVSGFIENIRDNKGSCQER